MKATKELSAQLAARLGPPASGNTAIIEGDGKRGGSDYSKLRGIIRTQKDQIQALENEVTHFQSRLHRIEDGHRLELARLKKEVEYHKRLRQGAEQRSYELEDQLSRQQLQQGAARQRNHDEEKDGLIIQSQLLVSKNSELTTRNQFLETQVAQLEELKAALENELNRVCGERDEMEEQLAQILHSHHHQIRTTAEEEEEFEGEGDDAEEEGAGPEPNGDAAGPAGDDSVSPQAEASAPEAAEQQEAPQEPEAQG